MFEGSPVLTGSDGLTSGVTGVSGTSGVGEGVKPLTVNVWVNTIGDSSP